MRNIRFEVPAPDGGATVVVATPQDTIRYLQGIIPQLDAQGLLAVIETATRALSARLADNTEPESPQPMEWIDFQYVDRLRRQQLPERVGYIVSVRLLSALAESGHFPSHVVVKTSDHEAIQIPLEEFRQNAHKLQGTKELRMRGKHTVHLLELLMAATGAMTITEPEPA